MDYQSVIVVATVVCSLAYLLRNIVRPGKRSEGGCGGCGGCGPAQPKGCTQTVVLHPKKPADLQAE